jgi:plastocyanin
MLSRIMQCIILLCLVSNPSIASAEDATWGTLEGRFQIDRLVEVPPIAKAGNPQIKDTAVCGKLDIPDETLVVNAENLGVGNIIVFLRKAPEQIHPDLVEVKEPALLKCENCRFVPHIMAIRTGQPLRVLMDDKVAHNSHFNPVANSGEGSIVVPPGDERTTTFHLPETLPVKVTCDIHSWMNGYVTVLDHPYCAITDKDGKFRIEKLPAGQHTFRVWHERRGYLFREWNVTINPDQTTTMPTETVPAEKFENKR